MKESIIPATYWNKMIVLRDFIINTHQRAAKSMNFTGNRYRISHFAMTLCVHTTIFRRKHRQWCI